MSVLIKGMKMPKNCCECPIKVWGYEGYICPFSGIEALNIGIQRDCPLIELPPHGRLIDADALPQIRGKVHIVDIAIAPTILEADVE